jgi:hypothetical protein
VGRTGYAKATPGFLVQVRRSFGEGGSSAGSFREAQMRKWLKNADSDDVTMVVSGAIAVLAFCTFVLVWFIAAPGPECGRNCSTEFSSVNHR